jgi:hypothetical protein
VPTTTRYPSLPGFAEGRYSCDTLIVGVKSLLQESVDEKAIANWIAKLYGTDRKTLSGRLTIIALVKIRASLHPVALPSN